jgi:DNA-binding IclR family transcriptional regulator
MRSETDRICAAILAYPPLVAGHPVSNKALSDHAQAHRSNMYWALTRMVKRGTLEKPSRGTYKLVNPSQRLAEIAAQCSKQLAERQITVTVNGLRVMGTVDDIRELLIQGA